MSTHASVTMSLGDLPGRGVKRAVTIGKFDGVHRGHQGVIQSLAALAGGAEVTVVTFDRHPRALLDPANCPDDLLSVNQKIDALIDAGAQRVAVIPFTQEFADLEPEEFSRHILSEGLDAEHVLVGKDFRYGHEGRGTLDTLRAEGERSGFAVRTVADIVHAEGERISSTLIRSLLNEGKPAQAAELLGRHHFVRSQVVHGHQRGRLLGYPTANLQNPVEGFVPRDGVYATWVTIAGEKYAAATSIGVNPTFGDVSQRMVESHLFGFEGDLYDQVIDVAFVEYIRPMNQFSDADELAAQMDRDAQRIREILS
jgi:riboflavin kinase/FMN adenylyltransferase